MSEEKPKQRLRLDYLDGIRGLSALYVVVAHAGVVELSGNGLLAKFFHLLYSLMPYGNFSVSVFIVLSGYCLMLPVARSEKGQLSGGVWGFFQRRARRILPPYYAAILLSLLIIAFAFPFHDPGNGRWDVFLPATTPGVLLSHLFLVHNWREEWIFKINGPMWSVAAEWQIYLLFPALMLPVWRRFGLTATLVVAYVVGVAPYLIPKHLLHNPSMAFTAANTHPWFLALFTEGMIGAVIGFSLKPELIRMREKLHWGWLSGGLFAVFVLAYALRPGMSSYPYYIMEPLLGASTTCLLIHYTKLQLEEGKRKPLLLRFFDWKPVLTLGAFSYSLYLMHFPILETALMVMDKMNLSKIAYQMVMWGVVVPFILVFCYLFYLVCERPFVSSFLKAKRP